MNHFSRRTFVKAGMLMGTSTLASGFEGRRMRAEAGDSEREVLPVRPLKLGIVTYNIARDWSLDDIFKNLEEVHIHGVELRATHAHGVELELSSLERARIRKRFEDSPIQLVQMGSAYEFHSPDPSVLQENIEGAKKYAQLAHDLGAPGIKVRPNGLPKEVPEEKTLEQIGKALREVGESARNVGVEVRVEVHGRETSRIPRMKRIMDIADHPNVVVNWNSNPTDLQDGGFEANFDLLKDKIRHVHMRDLFLEDYPWPRLLERLHEIEFEGWCCAEIPGSSDPLRVLRYYRALFTAYQGLFQTLSG